MQKYLISSFIALMLFVSCESSDKSGFSIDDNELLYVSDTISVGISVTDEGFLTVSASATEESSAEKRFFLRANGSTLPFREEKDDEGKKFYASGQYRIYKTDEEFQIYRNDLFLFSSVFRLSGKRLLEEKQTGEGELMYGMGQSSKSIIKGNDSYSLYHYPQYGDQTYMFIPQIYSSGGDSFYYNSHVYDTVRFGARESGLFETATGSKRLEFIYRYADTPEQAVSDFYRFSSSQNLLPRWAYGFIQSRYGYRNQQEVIDLVDDFEKREIPLSAVVLDLYWFKHMGDLDWDKENWPDPAALDSYLEERDIKLITISEPYVTSDSPNYSVMADQGLLGTNSEGQPVRWKDWWCFDSADGSIMNPFADYADEFWGSQYIRMREQGIDGFWTDLGEPENVPRTVRMNGLQEHEFHNYYNRAWSEMIYRSMKEEYPDERLFILSRSGYTGSAGYGVSNWSGDVPASFEGLADEIPLGLNASLTGFSYWGSDVGGFTGEPDPELLVRWYQFGLFSPVFRAHGTGPREPWSRGEEAESLISGLIDWRYRLLPYIYSSAWQTAVSGIPMMRPLFAEYPGDGEAWRIEDEYFFGDSLLVAPVTAAASKEKSRKYYLPEGNWLNLFDLSEREGGWHEEPFGLSQMPVFAREGSVIAMNDKGREALFIYPGTGKSSATIFSDDGWSEKYREGEGERLEISLEGKELTISGARESREIVIIIPVGKDLRESAVYLEEGITVSFDLKGF
ncbi:glycoside hydrolase family 31 protein [Spirochaeta isovalerica]|uniref:Alpha-glucosidase (Family GH31 glycosyl hydrolase) n=1 Tax=Spirochaeta isovalerica TaxID=150 RepID=A0A841R971_9SPIO|nr:glycoside hydrolase family 31 protein [Spirochaeta isovalerica]MBB6480336.1 alpha-glucosidase (family GH31 glycosyl hydrolase) [Spirochaeta isovalerica]